MTTKRWLILLAVNIMMMVSAIILTITQHEPQHISENLTAIKAQLSNLQQAITSTRDKIDAPKLSQDFNQLTTVITDLQNKDTSKLNQLITNSQSTLSQKLDAIHTVIESLEQNPAPIKYLKVGVLPFKVLSIDSIQQVSVASVAYDYKTIPLEKSDLLAGWKVLSIDFGTQTIELENLAKERVIVKLEGIE